MNEFEPLVSIVIPVYNGSNYMREAIDSALLQTYKNIEIIVVNDGSTDNTDEIAKSYGDKIRYFSKENGGTSTALNLAIKNMKGEYFSWLSHDDMYYPNKIERQIEELDKLKNNESIIFCNVTVINYKNEVEKHNIISDKIEKSMRCFLTFDTITGLNGCSLLIPASLFKKYGDFNIEYTSTQDYDLWYRFVNKGVCFYRVNEELIYSRIHENQGCRTLPNITENSDILHSSFIKDISLEEMKNYAEYEFYKEAYLIYYNAGYLRTAGRILALLFQYHCSFNKHKEAFELINTAILQLNNGYTKNNFNHIFSLFNKSKLKPRLVFYSNVWTKGGIERVLANIFPKLIDDFEVILVSDFIENEIGFTLPNSVKHIKLNKDLLEKLPYTLMTLCFIVNADIFIGNPNIIITFLNTYKLLNPTGIKTIAVNHGSYFLPFQFEWLYPVAINRHGFLHYAHVSTWITTHSTLTYASKNSNAYLMPNPNTFKVNNIYNNRKKEKIILCVGRFYDCVKRVDRALRVFASVIKQDTQAKLCLVGGYRMDMIVDCEEQLTLTMLLDELKIPKTSIEFIGEVNDVSDYYKKSSLLLLTSESEGFGMVINEAACFGVPTFYFAIHGLEDIITNEKNGYCLPQGDILNMSKRIVEYINNEELQKELSKNAIEMAERFTLDIIANRWKQLIKMLLESDEHSFNQFLKEELTKLNKNQYYEKHLINEYERIIFKLITKSNENINNQNKNINHKEVIIKSIKLKNIFNIGILKIDNNNKFIIITILFFIKLSVKINDIAWFIPVRKLRDKFRNRLKEPNNIGINL